MNQSTDAAHPSLLFDSLEDNILHTLALISRARRTLYILSHQLDPLVYNRDDVVNAVSRFARRARDSQVRILIRDTSDLLERGHQLARLHQRLPSKVHLRKLTIEPNNQQMGFIAADRELLVYKSDDTQAAGVANFRAAQEVKTLADEYQRLWQHAVPEPGLQILHL
ncbi:DUF7931 domain-containing protein [Gilvimarinus agarilyticus]|uniref:DUF7931 domain-containing protein n=1 Tax=Gilvimarinus agarilyticus TaxID=679259 RepID=UPI0006975284|nr:hypothetical protein [Gilvimarinus agarilyticus]